MNVRGHTSENIISRGWEEIIEKIKNDNLWFLLHWQVLQLKDKDRWLDKSKLKLLTMCLRIEDDGCPNLWCHKDEVVLILEKVIKGEDLTEKIGHSYTPSLVQPYKRISLMCGSFTWKVKGENVIIATLDLKNWGIEIRFFFMVET